MRESLSVILVRLCNRLKNFRQISNLLPRSQDGYIVEAASLALDGLHDNPGDQILFGRVLHYCFPFGVGACNSIPNPPPEPPTMYWGTLPSHLLFHISMRRSSSSSGVRLTRCNSCAFALACASIRIACASPAASSLRASASPFALAATCSASILVCSKIFLAFSALCSAT